MEQFSIIHVPILLSKIRPLVLIIPAGRRECTCSTSLNNTASRHQYNLVRQNTDPPIPWEELSYTQEPRLE